MVNKQEPVHMDVYNEHGVKTMDVHGLYDFDELSVEMVRALAHKQIPVIRRALPAEVEDASSDELEPMEGFAQLEHFAPAEDANVTLKWHFDGVEFSAEGPAEYVMRASAELLEHLEALT